jgi:integrase
MPRKPTVWFRESNQTYYTTINGKQIALGTDEKKAKDKLKAMVEAASTGSLEYVAVLFDEFLDDVKQNKADRTFSSYQAFLQSFVSFDGNLRIVDLKPDHVRRWLNAQGWNDSTKSIAIRTIKRAFNWAAEQGLIPASPLSGLKAPRTHARETLISPADWAKLLESVTDEGFRDILVILRETGCRPFEARQVTARDIREDCWVFSAKTSKGKRYARVVYLNPTALAITKKWAARHKNGPIFLNGSKPWTKNALCGRFRRLTADTGIKVFAYAFRHTFTTEGLENGVDSLTMAQFLGHQDTSMIARHYGHIARNKAFLMEQLRRARPSDEGAA